MAAKQARQNFGFFKVWHKNGRVLIQVNPQDRAIVLNNNKDLSDLIDSISSNSIQQDQPSTQQLPQPLQYQPPNQYQNQQFQNHIRNNQSQQQTYYQQYQQPPHQSVQPTSSQHQYLPQHSSSQQQLNKRARNNNSNNFINNFNNFENSYKKNFRNDSTNTSFQANRDPRNSQLPRHSLYRNPIQFQTRIPSILDPRFSAPPPQNSPHYYPVPLTRTATSTSFYSSSSATPTFSQNVPQPPPSVHSTLSINRSQQQTHPTNLSPLSNSMNSQLEQLESSLINFSQAPPPET